MSSMYILAVAGKEMEGAYAVDENDKRKVYMFLDKDDAVRYYEMLKDNDYPRKLDVRFMEEEDVKMSCKNYGYKFSVITPDDIVIPPPTV